MITIGIGGPVGVGKTAIIRCLCLELREEFAIGVLANDIRGSFDADYLRSLAVLEADRIRPVQTGNSTAGFLNYNSEQNREELFNIQHDHGSMDLVFIEGVGDRLDAKFPPDLVNLFIYVIDCQSDSRLPLKGGPGIEDSRLLVVNKLDKYTKSGNYASIGKLSLNIQTQRRGMPILFLSTETGFGVDLLTAFIRERLMISKLPEMRLRKSDKRS